MRNLTASLVAASMLTGCAGGLGSLSRILFTNTTAADAELVGVTGPFQELASTPLADAAEGVSVGGLLPLALPGETTPRLVLCLGEMAETCRSLKLNSRIRVSGLPDQRGIILPTRITVDER